MALVFKPESSPIQKYSEATIFLVLTLKNCMFYKVNNKQFKIIGGGDLSPLRKSLVRLREESGKLLDSLLEGELLMRGTVYEMKRKCGGANCICATEGKLHATMVISWSEEGKTRLKVLPELKIDDYRRMTARNREFRKLRKRFEKVCQEMMKIIDRVETKRRKAP